eukprot:1144257-Pelagomonas_calceolata.AAC.1
MEFSLQPVSLAAQPIERVKSNKKKYVSHLPPLIARAPVTHRCSILLNSQFNLQSMSMKPEPAHITHNLLRLEKERKTMQAEETLPTSIKE